MAELYRAIMENACRMDDPTLLSEFPTLTAWSQYLDLINKYSAVNVLEWIICSTEDYYGITTVEHYRITIVGYLQHNWHEVLLNQALVDVLLGAGYFTWRDLPYAVAKNLPEWVVLPPAYRHKRRAGDHTAFAALPIEDVWKVLIDLNRLPDNSLNEWHSNILDHLLRAAILAGHRPTIASTLLLLGKHTRGLSSYNTIVPVYTISSESDKDLFLYVQSLMGCKYDSAICVDEESPPSFEDVKWFVSNSSQLTVDYVDIPVYILAQDPVPFRVCSGKYWSAIVHSLRRLVDMGLVSRTASPTLTLNHLSGPPNNYTLYAAAAVLGLYDICRALAGWGFHSPLCSGFDKSITDPFEIRLGVSTPGDFPKGYISSACYVKNIVGSSGRWGQLIINAICKTGVHPSPGCVYNLADQSPILRDGASHICTGGVQKNSTLEFIKLLWCLVQGEVDNIAGCVLVPPVRIRRYLRRRYPDIIAE